MRVRAILVMVVGILAVSSAGSQASGASRTETETFGWRAPIINPPRRDGLWPGLRVRDAMDAVRMLRFQMFVMYLEAGKRHTVKVRSADMRMVEESRLPPPYSDGTRESRWDLLLNGQVIDPRQYAIIFDERIVNLAVLYTYGREFYPDEQGKVWLDE